MKISACLITFDEEKNIADAIDSVCWADEILSLKNVSEADLTDGYKIPRLSFYMNRPIKHGGWYPDWQIRFFNRKNAKWKDVAVHESVEVSGTIAKLSGEILHYSIENAAYHHRMIGERYAPLSAEQMYKNGRRTSRLKLLTVGWTTFIRNYFLKLGFLDGVAGFCIARFAAHHSFLKHLLLWEIQEEKAKGKRQKAKF